MLHLLLILVQQTQAPAATPPETTHTETVPAPERESGSARVEALRSRIHGMRMDLLLGGDKVRQAENDAAQFYKGKVEVIDQRLDSIAGELVELKASYQSTLGRTLQASGEARPAALREAADQRARIQALQSEEAELGDRRGHVEKLVGAVEARGRERQRLAAKIESNSEYGEAFAMQLGGGIGLAPDVETTSTSSPLHDDGLIDDLLALDPAGARRVLFEGDPEGYWRRFPLRPPEAVLRTVLKFPAPDLPGQR
jgi:hypothetical protein